MKKSLLFLTCLSVFALSISGCQNSSTKKIENTTNIVIGYGFNSYAAMITDQEEIKQLEDAFNEAEFAESDSSIQQPYLIITFYCKKGTTSFYVDENDVIKLKDGSYKKSKQINFKRLYSIYNEYLSSKK